MNFIDGILALAGSVQDLIGEIYLSYLDEMNMSKILTCLTWSALIATIVGAWKKKILVNKVPGSP